MLEFSMPRERLQNATRKASEAAGARCGRRSIG